MDVKDIEVVAVAAYYLYTVYKYYKLVHENNARTNNVKTLQGKLKRRCWARKIHRNRTRQTMNKVLSTLLTHTSKEFNNFVRMSCIDFECILQKISPIIAKKDTSWREAIPTKIRLALTLRFLATGESYRSLHELFKISTSLISRIVPEVCLALNQALEDMIQVIGFPNMYRFLRYEHEKQRRNPNAHTSTLVKDRRVRWAEQLFEKTRVKRSPMLEQDQELIRVKRLKENIIQDAFYLGKPLFNDELWTQQWYLQDTRTFKYLPRLDLNVLPVYRLGYNGSGVRISVLDDGIEHNHTDLKGNYDPEISWDSNDGDPDPSPRYEEVMTNSHGTRCAGEIAMTANNLKCGVGVAWGARIGGVRMLDGRITDRVEAEAIAYAADKVDIYSASWGPNDDGRTVEGPGRLAMEAFKKGVTVGRGGKGAIYIWANGNGGAHEDNCNCDGYSSSIYTVSIGSASQHGKFPWYGEICSSTLAAAYSSGAYTDQKIATTDTRNSCTLKHTGTSAAAPLAAGIVALALQANPNLTWRDVQHLIVWTSDYVPLSQNPGWQTNGVGLHFDVRFGFGLLNAFKLVNEALNWTTVPNKHTCHVEASPIDKEDAHLFSRESVNIEIPVDGCAVNYLEHVEAIVNIKYSRRGALEIYLTSPQGTKVQLLSERPKDTSNAGFVNWPMTSVATWGERPAGIWILTVEDMTDELNSGEIGTISLIMHGTNEMPAHMNYGDNTLENTTFQTISEEHDNIVSLDPTVLAQFEKELQRIHHRKDNFDGIEGF